ncbi:MAG: acyl-protein synthetase [Polyangiales bacterium]
MTTQQELERRVDALIANPGTPRPEACAQLIEDMATWQRTRIDEYARLRRRGDWPPAMPTDVFRVRRMAAHPPARDRRVFHSSGTTSTDRSVHAFEDLHLYDAAARSAAKHMLFPDVERIALIILAPDEHEAPHSSLSYMLARFVEWFGGEVTFVWRDNALDMEGLRTTLANAESTGLPIAILGTSFAFVHAEDALGKFRVALAHGSRVMHTGGYKGRSREVEPRVLRRAIGDRYGIAEPWIVAEYGMTELSSQLYETTLRNEVVGADGERALWSPPWVRVTPVDPETLAPVEPGTQGVLRIDDCANLGSLCCIQTSDLARQVAAGVIVEGRAPGASPRGCSLAADQALGVQG